MQLHKQVIRRQPTFSEKTAPRGVKRAPADFNQVNNTRQINRNKKGDSFKSPTAS